MNIFSEVACKYNGQGDISSRLVAKLGLNFAQIYQSPSNIIALSQALKEEKASDITILPFCHTVEAKAFGADIFPGDDSAGPRPGSYICKSLDEFTGGSILESQDVQQLLKACLALKGQGERVAYKISGPVSILSCFMDLALVFKAWRKEQDSMVQVFQTIKQALLEYVTKICKTGVDYISYADPVGNPNILGPKYSALLAEQFTIPFLTNALSVCQNKATIVLCPQTALSLLKLGLAETRPTQEAQLASRCTKSMDGLIRKNIKLL